MQVTKIKGPKTEPCGTTHVIVDISESNPLTETVYVQKDSSNLFDIPVIP